MAARDYATGIPLAVHTTSAPLYEVSLLEATLDETLPLGRPERLIGDRAYDSDPLDRRFAARGIEAIPRWDQRIAHFNALVHPAGSVILIPRYSKMTSSMVRAVLSALAVILMVFQLAGAAEGTVGFPTKPIRLVLPVPPGGGTDVLGRVLGQKLSAAVGQPVVIDNRVGGGGSIGTTFVSKAAPDGYTILFVSSSFTIQPSATPNLQYDSIRDFAPITLAFSSPYLLVVNPSLEARSVKELLDLARLRPGKINCATAGPGSALHLAAELFNSLSRVNIVLVPYKGPVGITDLIAGHIEIAFAGMPQTLPHIRTERLRPLAVTTPSRSSLLPDIPTLHESGVAGYDVTVWYGMMAPARTPKNIIAKYHTEIVKVLQGTDVKQTVSSLGIDTVGSTPEKFADTIRIEINKWNNLSKQSGFRPS